MSSEPDECRPSSYSHFPARTNKRSWRLQQAESVVLGDPPEVLKIARPLDHPSGALRPTDPWLERDPHRLVFLQRQGLARLEDAVLIDGTRTPGWRSGS